MWPHSSSDGWGSLSCPRCGSVALPAGDSERLPDRFNGPVTVPAGAGADSQVLQLSLQFGLVHALQVVGEPSEDVHVGPVGAALGEAGVWGPDLAGWEEGTVDFLGVGVAVSVCLVEVDEVFAHTVSVPCVLCRTTDCVSGVVCLSGVGAVRRTAHLLTGVGRFAVSWLFRVTEWKTVGETRVIPASGSRCVTS